MKLRSSRVMLALVAGSMLAQAVAIEGQNAPGAEQQGPPVRVTRIFTGTDRQTHFDQVDVKLSAVPGAPATIEKSAPVRVTRSYLVRAAAGAVEGWHRSDTRRYMIAISGRAKAVHRAGTDSPG